MLKKNKLYLIIPIEIFFLFFLLIVIPSIFLKEKPGINQISFENILPLDINHSYLQPFVSNRNNLNSISVLLKNPSLESRNIVYLEVLNDHQEIIRSFSISGSGIEDPGWLTFKFPVIKSPKGTTFYIKVTSNSQKDNQLYIYGDKNSQNINFKTTFTHLNLRESFQDNLNQQFTNFQSRNIFLTLTYFVLLLLANIFILT